MKLLLLLMLLSPVREYKENVCVGLSEQFAINDGEFFGYITEDNQLIVTNVGDFNSVESAALIEYNDKLYYSIKDVCSVIGVYKGSITNNLGIFIPIKSTIHSHNPKCVNFEAIGAMSAEDVTYAAKYRTINHYIIGCGMYAQYNHKKYVFQNSKCPF